MLPHELASAYVAPYLRALVAIELFNSGLSQVRVSKLLNVSQPMVRKYVSRDKTEYYARLEGAGISREECEAAVKVLTDIARKRGRFEYFKTFSQIINSLLSKCTLCRLHRRLDPEVPPACDLCRILFPRLADAYIEDVKNALGILQSYSTAYKLIPEVGMNIVSAPPNAERPEDVVGFVGRIIRVGSRVVAVGEPAYGGSRHTASVLLAIRRRWRELRSAVVIRYDEGYVEKFKELGYRLMRSGPHRSRAELIENILEIAGSSRGSRDPPDALIDLGGLGLEPVIYVFGKTATEAVTKALKAITS